MAINIATATKVLLLPEILKAAEILHGCQLIEQHPSEVVKLFVKKNPDINKWLSRHALEEVLKL